MEEMTTPNIIIRCPLCGQSKQGAMAYNQEDESVNLAGVILPITPDLAEALTNRGIALACADCWFGKQEKPRPKKSRFILPEGM